MDLTYEQCLKVQPYIRREFSIGDNVYTKNGEILTLSRRDFYDWFEYYDCNDNKYKLIQASDATLIPDTKDLLEMLPWKIYFNNDWWALQIFKSNIYWMGYFAISSKPPIKVCENADIDHALYAMVEWLIDNNKLEVPKC